VNRYYEGVVGWEDRGELTRGGEEKGEGRRSTYGLPGARCKLKGAK
jgi:hypothetical protein